MMFSSQMSERQSDTGMVPTMASSLTPARRRLLVLCRYIGFGAIERLHIHRGEPVYDPPPRITREIRFGAHRTPTRQEALDEFKVRRAMRELLSAIAAVGDGIVDRIEIRHGQPFRLFLSAKIEIEDL